VTALADQLGAKVIPAEALIGVECELLVPAALEDMITVDNAHSIKAKVLLELANGPVTPDADTILKDRGIVILPDILANAGGVTVSYFEWVQNRQGYYWDLEEIHARLLKMMEREGRAVWTIAKERGVTVRTAAYIHALARLSTAIEAHGTQPFFVS
jgi:glutamate dehydrogenase (NADP+)